MPEPTTLIDRLIEIAASNERHDGTETFLFEPTKKVYVSGVAYTFSCFAERAFIFRDAAQARAVLEEFALVLKGFVVRDRHDEAWSVGLRGKKERHNAHR